MNSVVDEFHKLYYYGADQTLRKTRWLGNRVIKCPLDLWVYQEIIWDTRPDLIVETGSGRGGSAHFMACMCDIAGHDARILSIDVRDVERQQHARVTFLHGSSTDPGIVERVRAEADGAQRVMVLLDSDHSRDHVLEELREYAPLVTPGCYLIVEDTNVNGHPVVPDHGPGPMEAVDEFLATDAGREFSVQPDCEKFFLTMNPRGYLRRAGSGPA